MILNYSARSTAELGIFGRSRATRRDVDETQKSLIYHVETRNAKIVARIRSGPDLARVCATVPARVIGLDSDNEAAS